MTSSTCFMWLRMWWPKLAKKYEALKAIYSPMYQVQSPMHSADGQMLLTNRASILNCWLEHFQALFSANRSVQEPAILRIPQQPVKMELDELPTIEETTKAIKQLKCSKAAGVYGIPPEIWKHGGPVLHMKHHMLFCCCWEHWKIPQDLHNAVIITLYKNKGEKSDCFNY